MTAAVGSLEITAAILNLCALCYLDFHIAALCRKCTSVCTAVLVPRFLQGHHCVGI